VGLAPSPDAVCGVCGAATTDTTPRASPPRPSQSGLSVATTNHSATAIVTVCEKINQVLRIASPEGPERPLDYGPRAM